MHLHYEEAGQGPPVVLLHGGGPGASGASNFAKNLPVPEHFRTLVIDQPGYGKSDKPPVRGNYFTFAAGALARLLDEVGLDRVHLVGNSLGGGTAVRFALNYPDCRTPGPDGPAACPQRVRPDPTEGVKRLTEFAAPPGPSREKMAAFRHAGLRQAAGYRAHRPAVRRGLRPRGAGRDGVDGRVVLRPGQLDRGAAVAGGAPAAERVLLSGGGGPGTRSTAPWSR